jgi:hypothetical protein
MNTKIHPPTPSSTPASTPNLQDIRTSSREFVNPVDYRHPHESMARFADFLALRYDANRTRHAYYRQLRLIHEHFDLDPATLTEARVREWFLHLKLKRQWSPKSLRQARAALRMFFVDQLAQPDWKLFSQIRTPDHDTLPAVLTRLQVHQLLAHVRLRRYRTPLKLIYGCGLRQAEPGPQSASRRRRIGKQALPAASAGARDIRIGWCHCPPAFIRTCATTGSSIVIRCSSFPMSVAAIAIPPRWPRACGRPPSPCRTPRCNGC